MNTETNTKGRGRPFNENSTRVLHVNPDTGVAYGRGRLAMGTKVLEVVVHRKYNSSNYQHGQTPVKSMKEIVTEGTKKPVSSIQVKVMDGSEPVESPIKINSPANF